METMRIVIAAAAVMIFALPSVRAARAEKIEILRDTWGVPHIYAETEIGALYGQGYAMAEDRLGTMMKAYRRATGRMAEYFGPDWVESDYIARVFRHEEISRARYGELPEFYRRGVEAFVAGMKRYMEEHPEKVPDWAIEVEPYHLLALARNAIWGWPLGQAWDELKRAEPKPDTGEGSNQWAVMGRRTADGNVITLIDPHVSWQDEWLFYEVHLHGGDLNAYGFNVTGLPYIGLGHNEYISWAFTTGGPDTADVYELVRNPENPLQYRYDGEWRTATHRVIEIPVKTENGIETVRRDLYESHHGPIVEIQDDRAYAFKLAYADVVEFVVQFGMINKARNLGDFLQAMEVRALMPQNAMYGDVYGNIYYQRTGRVPIRPEGFDWTRPVPGDTSKTEWLGLHKTADLVQLLNPAAGWMQNCNISPGTMTEKSPLTADRYPFYLYMADTNGTNSRGRRANALLSSIERMTLEDAIAIANDTYMDGERPWRDALLAAYDAVGGDSEDLVEAIRYLREWDGHAKKESVGVTVFEFWMRHLDSRRDRIPIDAIRNGDPIPEAAQRELLAALEDAIRFMKAKYGKIAVEWQRVFRAKRGSESWGIDGNAGAAGLVTLRAVSGRDLDEEGVSYVRAGQSCTTVVILKEGDVRSYSVVPYGQSEDPESPHFTDQGRLLFAEGKLKDSWFSRERLEGNIESRTVLEIEF